MKNEQVLKQFEMNHTGLIKRGSQINGIAELVSDNFVISVSVPFIFDNRAIPKEFMGLRVRSGIGNNDLPEEFKGIDKEKEYIWAYQRFENYVENNEELIRKILGNPDITKSEMLHALCFGDFEKHKEN